MGLRITSSEGVGNATVPVDAPILPPQAFVDAAPSLFWAGVLNNNGIALSSLGITYIDTEVLEETFKSSYGKFDPDAPSIDLSGNALPAIEINAILAALVSEAAHITALDVSGGTNAAPTGQGITDKATLITAGWTVTTN